MKEAAETVLETVNTCGEEFYTSRAITKWVSGEFKLQRSAAVRLKSPQISRGDVSLLPTWSRTQHYMIKGLCAMRPSIHQSTRRS